MPRLRGPKDFEPGDLVCNSYNDRVSVHNERGAGASTGIACARSYDFFPGELALVLAVSQPPGWQLCCLLLAPEGIGYVMRDLLRRAETT